MKTMIVTRPCHDVTTRYLSAWARQIIELARQKGFEVIDLEGSKANKNDFEGRVKKVDPQCLFLNGHGNDEIVAGHDNQALLQKGKNDNLLDWRISYAVSCDSAQSLGKSVEEKKHSAYIGYTDKFIFVADQRYLREPAKDPSAEPFMESSNQVMISLLKGHNANEASARSRSVFRERYLGLLASNADPDTLTAVQYLWWNWKHQICIGDGEATLSVNSKSINE